MPDSAVLRDPTRCYSFCRQVGARLLSGVCRTTQVAQAFAGFRTERRTSGHCHHHEVNFRITHRVLDRASRGRPVRSHRKQGAHTRMAPGERFQPGGIVAGDHRPETESVRVAFDQIADLPADRSGGPQQGKTLGRGRDCSHGL